MSLPVDVGQTLRCSTGTWTNNPTSYSYQWQRGGSDIGGATSSSYTAGTADAGSTLDCVVIAHNAAGESPPKTSNISDAVSGGGPSYPDSYFTGPLGANNILPAEDPGVLVSMWCLNYQGDTDAQQRTMIQQRMTDCNRTFDLIGIQRTPMNSHDGTVSSDWLTWIHSIGSVPLMSWYWSSDFAAIAAGTHDSTIDAAGTFLATLSYRVMIRLFQEYNLTIGDVPSSTDQTNFKNAWHRVVDRVLAKTTAGGRTNNVGFYMCPTDAGRQSIDSCYPGDTYVDWVGCDQYNWAPVDSPAASNCWQEAQELWAYDLPPWNVGGSQNVSTYSRAVNHGKPFAIGETGCQYAYSGLTGVPGGDITNAKANWFRHIASVAKPTMSKMVCVQFFDQDVTRDEGVGTDNRVDSNATANTLTGTADATTYQGFKDLAGTAVFNVGVLGAL